MQEGLLALALGAGMLAAVNPCGFALLPAYLSLLIVSDADPGRSAALVRALILTGAMTVGFVAVFGTFGLVISPAASSLQQYLPWITIGIGLLVAVAGLWLLVGRALPTLGWRPRGPELRRSLPAMVGFGASYAVASLTCTVAPFLALVVTSFRTGSTWNGVQLFTAYAVGMGLVVGTAAVAVALANASLVARMRRTGRWVPRFAGALLLFSGGYVAYYGWWEIRVFNGGGVDDPVISRARDIQQYAAQLVGRLGPAGVTAILLGLAVVSLALRARRRRQQRHEPAT